MLMIQNMQDLPPAKFVVPEDLRIPNIFCEKAPTTAISLQRQFRVVSAMPSEVLPPSSNAMAKEYSNWLRRLQQCPRHKRKKSYPKGPLRFILGGDIADLFQKIQALQLGRSHFQLVISIVCRSLYLQCSCDVFLVLLEYTWQGQPLAIGPHLCLLLQEK